MQGGDSKLGSVVHGYHLFKLPREKEGDLTQSYDGSSYTNRKLNKQLTKQKRH